MVTETYSAPYLDFIPSWQTYGLNMFAMKVLFYEYMKCDCCWYNGNVILNIESWKSRNAHQFLKTKIRNEDSTTTMFPPNKW